MRREPGPFVHLGQQHQAVDAGALDPRGVVERRPDPRFRLLNHGDTEVTEMCRGLVRLRVARRGH